MKYTKEDGRLVKSNWLMQKDEYKAKSVQYVIWIPNKGYYRTRALLTSNPLNATKFYNKQEAKNIISKPIYPSYDSNGQPELKGIWFPKSTKIVKVKVMVDIVDIVKDVA